MQATRAELYLTAVHMGVSYTIGNVFYTDNCGSYRIRINYGAHSPEDIEKGFRLLGRAWRELACEYEDIEKAPLL